MEYLWGSHLKFVDDNAVSVNIRRLRVKTEKEPSSPVFIKTVYGMGYIWDEVKLS